MSNNIFHVQYIYIIKMYDFYTVYDPEIPLLWTSPRGIHIRTQIYQKLETLIRKFTAILILIYNN